MFSLLAFLICFHATDLLTDKSAVTAQLLSSPPFVCASSLFLRPHNHQSFQRAQNDPAAEQDAFASLSAAFYTNKRRYCEKRGKSLSTAAKIMLHVGETLKPLVLVKGKT